MKTKRLSILHFNILEKYPPVLNLISDALAQKPAFQISVITSVNNSPYKNRSFSGVKILRLGSTSKNAVLRYASYLSFNIIGTFILLLKRPDVVLVYESLSIFPAFVYAKFFPKKKIHVHFHEYVSLPEKEISSKYMKLLYNCEEKLLLKYTSSQTNEDRKQLFLKDNVNLKSENVSVFPNMPPKSWWLEIGQNKKPWDGGKIKLVYVGVLDAETMYLEEVLNWVKTNPRLIEITFFCQQISSLADVLLNQYSSKNIIVKPPINYYELPNELPNFDLGIILYNGYNLNHIFSVPNKVFEYLSCGLPVLADNALISLKKSKIEGVFQTNLNQINYLQIQKLLNSRFDNGIQNNCNYYKLTSLLQ